jgi:hypothetical protein
MDGPPYAGRCRRSALALVFNSVFRHFPVFLRADLHGEQIPGHEILCKLRSKTGAWRTPVRCKRAR